MKIYYSNMKVLKYYFIFLFFIDYYLCHMFISNITFKNNNKEMYAYPRRSEYDPEYIDKYNLIDYNMMSPLFSDDNRTYPCRGYEYSNNKLPIINESQEITINFDETDNFLNFHNGGIIQQYSIALKKNRYKNFTVIKNISKEDTFEKWKNKEFKTKIKIPYNIQSDNIVLAWSWFSNHLGNDNIEFFMNCIDLKIVNNYNITDKFDNINNIIIPCKIKNIDNYNYCNLNSLEGLIK